MGNSHVASQLNATAKNNRVFPCPYNITLKAGTAGNSKGRAHFIDTRGRPHPIDTKGRTNLIDTKGRPHLIDMKGKVNLVDSKGKREQMENLTRGRVSYEEEGGS